MYMSIRQYGKVLEKFGHTGEQYRWRYQEFTRFKEAMDSVLKSSRFREVLSRTMLHQIVETGLCRMPSMYFMEAAFGISTRRIASIFWMATSII